MVENMLSSHDLGPMDFFLMAAISRGGLNSLYAFQRHAELQPGSISSTINSLGKFGLLGRRDAEKRGRRPMVLTETGERILAEQWRGSLNPHREIESVFRSATVALLMGDVDAAIEFLFRSASERSSRLGPEGALPYFTGVHPVDLHAEMRAVYDRRRRSMEASLLQEFAAGLRELGEKEAGAQRPEAVGSGLNER